MRILLIQHPFLRLKRMLLREGYAVDTAVIKEASDSMARAADVIVLDLKADGQDAMASLKGWRERNIQTPVLALAAEEAATEKIAALDAGADAFMVKPCDDAELRAQVRALLRRVAADAEARVRIFDLELGVGDRMVRRAGQPIKLTRREFQLLTLLASNRGKVVTRAQIWRSWEAEAKNRRPI